MDVFGLFWFFMWRSVPWGLGLGACMGAAYGLIVGAPFIPLGILIGPLLGALYGALAGLPLGIVEGAALCGVTLLLHRYGVTGNVDQYRRIAGRACAAACMLAVALFWGVIFWRADDPAASVRVALTRDLPEGLIIVAGPLLLATGAAWWAGRKVAAQYINEFEENS